jgi:hypothetical protein
MTGEPLAAALSAAGRGWHVFPLRPDDKRPAVHDWETRATTDTGRIRRAWSAGAFGIAVACGPSGLLVVDLDVPKPGQAIPGEWAEPGVNDGRDVFTVVCQRAGQPPPFATHTVTTGRGGTHLYYAAPPAAPQLRNTAGRLGWLVDTRGHGGYVVAAGSTVAGRPYRTLLDPPPIPLPNWLADLLTPPPPTAPAAPVIPRAGRTAAYVAAAIDDEVRRVRNAPDGQHNKTLYMAAFLLGRLVAGGALDETTVRTALLAAAGQRRQTAHCECTDGEASRTITSGLRDGATRPRTVAA